MKRLAVACILCLAAGAARAQTPSPRWGSLELSAGTYRPNIDGEFAAKPGPYETVFGTKRGWRFDLGLSRAILTGVGSLEAGVRVGFFQASGDALTLAGVPSAEKTRFRMIPASLTLTYRFDLLADRWNVPFAPYGRAALERYSWWVTKASGGSVKSGATNGWSLTGGLALLLDFFDPTLARELDRDTGINHTYVFVEVTKTKVDDFGSSKSWDLSDERVSVSGGLLFAF